MFTFILSGEKGEQLMVTTAACHDRRWILGSNSCEPDALPLSYPPNAIPFSSKTVRVEQTIQLSVDLRCLRASAQQRAQVYARRPASTRLHQIRDVY